MYEEFLSPDFRGIGYIIQDEEVVLECVSGYRDYANELPNTIDTKFASASAGKVFVAVGILQLIEKGKLHFEDTIGKPMMYPKGSKFQYNNTGFVVLAMIIERVTRLPFDQYLKENIFDKCNMTGTGYYELDRLPAKCATNYVWCNGKDDLRTNIFCVDAKGTGAGGAYITVKDIANFWKERYSVFPGM